MATESKPIRKAIIDTEFITIMNAKENIIYSAAMVVVDEQGKEIYANEWDLTYNLKGYAPHTYKYGLALANTPKYRPARGEVKTRYRKKKRKTTWLFAIINKTFAKESEHQIFLF